MRKKRVFWGLLLLFCFGSVGLFPDFGIRGGYLSTNFADGEYQSFSAFQGGVYLRFRISDRFFLEQECSYVSMGLVDVMDEFDMASLAPWEIVTASNQSRRDLGYLSLPFMLRYLLTAGEGIRPTLFAGGYVAIRLSRKYDKAIPPEENGELWHLYESTGTDLVSGPEDLFYAEHKMFDVGVHAGAGIEKIVGKFIFGLDVRVNVGLYNLYSKFSTLPNSNQKKNFFVALVLGIGIPVEMGL